MIQLIVPVVLTLQLIQQAAGTSTIVPLYVYPEYVNGQHTWQPLINAHQASGPTIKTWAVVNPWDGPGGAVDTNYQTGIQLLQTASINVIGYVHTSWGGQSPDAVQKNITKWKSFYPTINGIFFDEMASQATFSSYYSGLQSFAKGAPQSYGFTVGNPGGGIEEGLVGTLDVILIYENLVFPSSSTLAGLTFSGNGHSANQFGIIPYYVPTLSQTAIQQAKSYVSYIYVQSAQYSPWNSLPSLTYLEKLYQYLARVKIRQNSIDVVN